jgi:ELWxxDGT repeat protein
MSRVMSALSVSQPAFPASCFLLGATRFSHSRVFLGERAMLDLRHRLSLKNRLLNLITGPWTEHRGVGRSSRLSLVGLEPMEARTHLSVALVENINASGSSFPDDLTNVNGTLFFTAQDGVNGEELWKSDGTANGTVLVKDIFSGSSESIPDLLINVSGTLFFTADDGVNGRELWKSDGTTNGTVMVKDIRSGASGSNISNLTVVNGTLFFTANDGDSGNEIWKSDGTESGTVLVKNIRSSSSGSNPDNLTNVNGTLFFAADDGLSRGRELHKSDGTENGTVLVKDILAGDSSSGLNFLTNVNGTLFFQAGDDVNGAELWKSDGTESGTVLVKDIQVGAGGSFPSFMASVNGTLFMQADDGVNGYEVWKSDGTESGTVLVKDIRAGETIGSFPTQLTNVNGTLFFSAEDGVNGEELWKSDGTESGTVLVKDIRTGFSSIPTQFKNINGTLYFRARDSNAVGFELWKSDGTEEGTVLVQDISPGAGNSNPTRMTDVNGSVFFTADDGVNGIELFVEFVEPTISIGNVTVNEGDGTATLTVTLSQTVPLDITVQYATANGSATQPGDYTTTTGTLTILANQSSGTFTVPIVNDADSENAESFVVNLSSPTNATIADEQATVTIPLNDLPALSIGDVTVNEGDGTATLTVSLSQIAPFDVTVQFATANGTATQPGDYTSATNTLTVVAGQTSGTFTVPIINDSTFENAETFVVNLSSPTNATISDAQATVTIPLNDNALVSFGGKVVATYLDSNNERVTVRLSGPGSGTVLLPGAANGTGDALLIEVTGATDKTSLSITVAGKGSATTIPTIQVTGALGRLTAPATTVTTSLSITGTAKSVTLAGISGQLTVGAPVAIKDKLALKLGVVSELNINAATPIGSLSVVDWQDNADAADTITTPWIGSLSATGRKAKGLVTALAGDFEAGLLLSAANAPKQVALSKATIAGKLSGSDWTLSGHAGTVTVGSISGSRIALGEGTQTVLNFKALSVKGSKLDVNGPAFVKSQVFVTGTLGSAKLNLVDLTQDLDNPSVSRFLGLRGDVLSLVNFRAAGLNTGKPVTLKKLLTTNDLADPKKNPANVAATTNQFKLVIV